MSKKKKKKFYPGDYEYIMPLGTHLSSFFTIAFFTLIFLYNIPIFLIYLYFEYHFAAHDIQVLKNRRELRRQLRK